MSRRYGSSRYPSQPRGSDSPKYLKVTGLNDSKRVDRTDRPFFSFDGASPREIDDAIRVTQSSRGNFQLEVAIVDGAQLPPDDKQTQRAVKLRQSRYAANRQYDALMLSPYVIRAMELRGGRRRAILLTQQFDADAQPMDEAAIVPAWIAVSNHTTGSFLGSPKNHAHDMAAFAQRWLDHGKKLAPLNERTDARMVNACMTFANKVVTEWVQQEDVAIPLRIAGSADDHHLAHFTGPTNAGDVESPHYVKANYTAPLRIAAHLITHQQVGAHLAGIEPPYSTDDIDRLAPRLYVTK